jgi:putative transposase
LLLDTKSISHCRYNINYHLVWCPKYRHQVLTGEIEIFLKSLIDPICRDYGYKLLNLIVKTIKSIRAVKIFKQFPGLKAKKFWGSGLWSKGYYVGTAGPVTSETIQKYIQEQKLRG